MKTRLVLKNKQLLISTTTLLLLSTISLAYYYFSSSQDPEPAIKTTTSLMPEINVAQSEHIVEAPPITETEAVQASTSHETADPSSAFSNRVPQLFAQRRFDNNTFITRDDLPASLQWSLDQALEEYNRNGYLHTDESYIAYMDMLEYEVNSFELNDPKLMIVPEEIDNTLLSELDYVGVIPDKVPDRDDLPVPGIRRVFKHEAGSLSLYEGDLANSEALLQKEFVNKSVKGYPATQVTSCAPSGRCVTKLSWLTMDKRYELALNGDLKAFGDDKLVEIASSLDLPPILDE